MSRPLFEPTQVRRIAGNHWGVSQLQRRFYPSVWRLVDSGNYDPRTETTDPPFENSWVNAGGGLRELRFRDSGFGYVDIQGFITGGTPPSVVFTVPAGYPLPTQSEPIPGTFGSAGVSVWQIDPDGSVWVQGAT